MTDRQIIENARRGDADAFETLMRQYEGRVYAMALRATGSAEDAADITQEAFLRVWRGMSDFRGDSGFATWLFRVTVNLCIDHRRHDATRPSVQPATEENDPLTQIADPSPTPEEHLEQIETGREIAQALDELSEEHRQIVLLRDVSGFSYSEIAETLDINEGTVKSRLARARLALRTVLLRRGNLLRTPSSNQPKGGGDA